MRTVRWIPLAALAIACSSSDEPDPESLPSGTAGETSSVAGASAGGSTGAPDSGLAPTSAGGAGLASPPCASRQRRYFEERGYLATGTVRGLLAALDEPEAFWEQLPTCSGDP